VLKEVSGPMVSDDESRMNRKKFLAVMRRPAFFMLINFFLVNTLFAFVPWGLGDIAYHIGRISIIFYAGLLVVRKNLGGIRQAAAAGVLMYFVDHVALKGGVFLLNHLFHPGGSGLAAFGSVIASFIMFIPLAMLIGAAGGWYARSAMTRSSAGPQ
jgi:hypothetical protein